MVLEELRVEAEEREARGVRDEVLEAVDHPRVEGDGVEQRRDVLEGVEEAAVLAARDVALQPRPVHAQPAEVEDVVGVLHLYQKQRTS